eukprot:CAMPEP_0206468588 /NCGR_PEP_ID=MMETSP0324_2-20121206/29720_1 /ASSEMBLY_ACC=CAM_ASM_000836 /TAXON_ID=2866 /ORGANISM="Crypthecodinium cohnii, Strain Seligo" /LENGTH=668 /DNA_ID=CAMNT_0053942077 /DNA_START=101 /DNA_END=2104 /DNA_ORIENTATION=+
MAVLPVEEDVWIELDEWPRISEPSIYQGDRRTVPHICDKKEWMTRMRDNSAKVQREFGPILSDICKVCRDFGCRRRTVRLSVEHIAGKEHWNMLWYALPKGDPIDLLREDHWLEFRAFPGQRRMRFNLLDGQVMEHWGIMAGGAHDWPVEARSQSPSSTPCATSQPPTPTGPSTSTSAAAAAAPPPSHPQHPAPIGPSCSAAAAAASHQNHAAQSETGPSSSSSAAAAASYSHHPPLIGPSFSSSAAAAASHLHHPTTTGPSSSAAPASQQPPSAHGPSLPLSLQVHDEALWIQVEGWPRVSSPSILGGDRRTTPHINRKEEWVKTMRYRASKVQKQFWYFLSDHDCFVCRDYGWKRRTVKVCTDHLAGKEHWNKLWYALPVGAPIDELRERHWIEFRAQGTRHMRFNLLDGELMELVGTLDEGVQSEPEEAASSSSSPTAPLAIMAPEILPSATAAKNSPTPAAAASSTSNPSSPSTTGQNEQQVTAATPPSRAAPPCAPPPPPPTRPPPPPLPSTAPDEETSNSNSNGRAAQDTSGLFTSRPSWVDAAPDALDSTGPLAPGRDPPSPTSTMPDSTFGFNKMEETSRSNIRGPRPVIWCKYLSPDDRIFWFLSEEVWFFETGPNEHDPDMEHWERFYYGPWDEEGFFRNLRTNQWFDVATKQDKGQW